MAEDLCDCIISPLGMAVILTVAKVMGCVSQGS